MALKGFRRRPSDEAHGAGHAATHKRKPRLRAAFEYLFLTIFMGAIIGALGNMLFDYKPDIESWWWRRNHAAEIQAGREGYATLLKADEAAKAMHANAARALFAEAQEKLLFAANGGSTVAMNRLIILYYCGAEPYIKKDSEKSYHWVMEENKRGNTHALIPSLGCQ
jgi:hypothetical protein